MSNEFPTVIVLSGGLSHEREVSLRSGRRVTQALRQLGVAVIEADVSASLLSLLEQVSNPVVFPVLHGGSGEDGSVSQVLQLAGVPYVGASAAAARLTFDKATSSSLAQQAGYQVPRQVVLPFEMFSEFGADHLVSLIGSRLEFPLMVKPLRGGSALGCTKVLDISDLPDALRSAYAYYPVAILEEFVHGTEVAVTVVARDGSVDALPAVEIRPRSGVYDYTARYTAGETRFLCPAELPDSVLDACAALALDAHRRLELGPLSRTDLIVDAAGQPFFLETSVAPGMTETSLVPLALAASGLHFGQVCLDWVMSATRLGD